MNSVDNSSKEYYSRETIAKDYDADRFVTKAGRLVDKFEKDAVLSNLPKNAGIIKAMDAGAGSGRFTIELAKRGINVVSCDYSPAMLEIIKSKSETQGLTEYITLSRQDVTNLTFEDNQFDFISCIRVFVNLDNVDNEIRALKELVRVCKPGGTIVFEVVNPMSLAAVGKRDRSMITLKKAKQIISSIQGVKIKKSFGRRILTQTLLEKTPSVLVGIVDKTDAILSTVFPQFSVRLYFVLEKQ